MSSIHPLILPHVDSIMRRGYGLIYNNDIETLPSIVDAPIFYENLVAIAPILCEEECERLSEFITNNEQLLSPNEEERVEHQIPELQLTDNPELEDELLKLQEPLFTLINPIFGCMYGTSPSAANSIQLARYNTITNKSVENHIDEDSVFTCVISLNGGEFEGGGTLVHNRGIAQPPTLVPPLSKGWGLFFSGRIMPHRSLDITSGHRDILVFWMT